MRRPSAYETRARELATDLLPGQPGFDFGNEMALQMWAEDAALAVTHRFRGGLTLHVEPTRALVAVDVDLAAGDGAGFLIVDDLVDSGVTAGVVRDLLPRAHFACLYAKPAGQRLADTWVVEVPQETWILFPWDTAPLFVPPLAKGGAPG